MRRHLPTAGPLRAGLLAGLLALLGSAACDTPSSPWAGATPATAEIYLRGTEQRIASMHASGWYGRLELLEGEVMELEVRFYDAANGRIDVGGRGAAHAELAAGAAAGRVQIGGLPEYLRVEGTAKGETRIAIQFTADGATRWSSPPLPVLVHERGVPVSAEVYRRGTTQRIGYVHGDHWHGQLTLQRQSSPGLDVRFIDATNRTIEFGTSYSVHAEVPSGDPAHLIAVENAGDHLIVHGLAAGTTRIVIHFRKGGVSRWSTPPFSVTVN